MKDIKIIFFDIDGTLIAMDQDTISEKTLEALKRLQEKGVKLCLEILIFSICSHTVFRC